MAHNKQTLSTRIELAANEKRALEALREVCRDQEEVNALLWAMVNSVQTAKATAVTVQ
jgi:hypothetical protein